MLGSRGRSKWRTVGCIDSGCATCRSTASLNLLPRSSVSTSESCKTRLLSPGSRVALLSPILACHPEPQAKDLVLLSLACSWASSHPRCSLERSREFSALQAVWLACVPLGTATSSAWGRRARSFDELRMTPQVGATFGTCRSATRRRAIRARTVAGVGESKPGGRNYNASLGFLKWLTVVSSGRTVACSCRSANDCMNVATLKLSHLHAQSQGIEAAYARRNGWL